MPPNKLFIVPCAVPAEGAKWTKASARHELGLPSEGLVVCSLARLEPHKALDDLIEALSLVPEPGRPFLAIAGEGTAREALERLASARLGHGYKFLGRIEDPGALYEGSELFVLPSRLEGFGIVFVEAAMHGVPSIACDTGGVSEAVVDGVTGLLVEPGAVAELAGAIKRLAGDAALRTKMGRAAAVRAKSEFGAEVMADRYEKLLLGTARPPR